MKLKVGPIFVGAVILAMLLFFEGVIRVFSLAPAPYRVAAGHSDSPLEYVDDPWIGYAYKPHYRDAFHLKNNLSYQTNVFGFRDRERTKERTRDPRIAFLGGSVIDGNFSEAIYDPKLGLYELESTIPGQLEKQLAPEHAEVLNFSVNGYCTRNEVELFEKRGLDFHPDLVLINFTEGDFEYCFGMMHQAEPKRAPALEFLFVHSALFRYVVLHQSIFNFKKAVKIHWDDLKRDCFEPNFCKFLGELDQAIKTGKVSLSPSFSTPDEAFNFFFDVDGVRLEAAMKQKFGIHENVKSGFETLKRLKASQGFPVVVAIWPCFSDTEVVDAGPGCHVESDVPGQLQVEKLAHEAGLETFRMSAGFRAKMQALHVTNPNQYFTIGDKEHPSARGAAVAAEILAQYLRERHLLTK